MADRRIQLLVGAVVFLSLAWMPGAAASAKPAGDEIRGVIVKSWGGCSSELLIWDSLNENWQQYGATPIFVDYTYQGLCGGPVTYNRLTASEADVVIISDPSGGARQFMPHEIAAIRRYARAGHNVIGTFLLLWFSHVDNSGLARLFGLPGTGVWDLDETVIPTYQLLEPDHPLFVGVGNPYVSQGYPSSQVPSDGTWDATDLAGARFVARNEAGDSVIVVNDQPTYTGVYVTHMPEYVGGPEDEQFFYNAITLPLG
jgi:hypothetical protein